MLYLSVLTQRSSISDASFTGNDGVTIHTQNSEIDWVCRLGSWLPAEGSFKGDFSVPWVCGLWALEAAFEAVLILN